MGEDTAGTETSASQSGTMPTSDSSTATSMASTASTEPADTGSTGCVVTTYYADTDDDGFGDPDAPTEACTAPEGHVEDDSDCDDEDGEINPDAMELCDGIDNDCDGELDTAECESCTWTVDEANGREYGVCTQELEWADAEAFCVNESAHLVAVEGPAENLFVANLLGTIADAWLGLSDSAREGTFVWTDGTAFGYTNWLAGQPDDPGGDEDCVAIGFTRQWSDVDCALEVAFVCERPAP